MDEQISGIGNRDQTDYLKMVILGEYYVYTNFLIKKFSYISKQLLSLENNVRLQKSKKRPE